MESNVESNIEINLEELWRDGRLGIVVQSRHEVNMIPDRAFLNKFGMCLKDFLFGVTKSNDYPLIVTKYDGYFWTHNMAHNMEYTNADFVITVDEILDGVTKPTSVTQEELDSILNA